MVDKVYVKRVVDGDTSLLVVAMIGILVIIFQFVNHSGPFSFSGSESQHQSDNSNLNGKTKYM